MSLFFGREPALSLTKGIKGEAKNKNYFICLIGIINEHNISIVLYFFEKVTVNCCFFARTRKTTL